MNFFKATRCGHILNIIPIDCEMAEKMDTYILDFSYNCDLE